VIGSIDFIYHLILAFGVGALVGLEREHHKGDDVVIAGIRTFPLVAVLGFVLAYLGKNGDALGLNSNALGLPFMALIGIPIVSTMAMGLLYIRYQMGVPGLTTPIALILTYINGVLVGYDLIIEAVVVSVMVTTLLVSRKRLHAFAEVLDDYEIISALQFIAVAFIIYPLTLQLNFTVPFDIMNRGQALDISNLFLIVIFVSSISFISFLLIRFRGIDKGLYFSGLLGGLVNSEATTVSLSNLAKQKPELVGAVTSGIILAVATMFLRDLAVSFVADPSATAMVLTIPFLALFGLGLLLGMLFKAPVHSSVELEFRNPFALGPAFKFAAVFIAISALNLLLVQNVSSSYFYLAALGGLISSAAVVASVSTLAFVGSVSPSIAAETALFATAIATLNKLAFSWYISKEVSKRALVPTLIMAIAAFSMGMALVILRNGL
jgi:uncharacterized membrane protein (DUF4010 family)